jgi:hypothetical protein
MIQVRNIGDNTFEVTVEGRTTTKHKVTVDPAYGRKLTGGRVSPEVLIEKSFAFLLEREPNTSILRVFDLSVIGKYFPEYELEIRNDMG